MTLRRNCRCPCHKAKDAILHVVPCCGPGSGPPAKSDAEKLSKVETKKPKLGTLKGRILIHDPNWRKPMTEREVDELFGKKNPDHRK